MASKLGDYVSHLRILCEHGVTDIISSKFCVHGGVQASKPLPPQHPRLEVRCHPPQLRGQRVTGYLSNVCVVASAIVHAITIN